MCHTGNGPTSAANNALICAARTALPELLDEHDRLARENAALREALQPFASAWLIYTSANPAYEDVTVKTEPLADAVELLGWLGDDGPYERGENWTTKFRAAARAMGGST